MTEAKNRSAREIAREVLNTEAAAVAGLVEQLDREFDQATKTLLGCKGRVVCTGMGKSGIVMRKIAATLSSTGTPAMFLHPAEALHGDLGMVAPGDVVLAASFSGVTDELLRLVEVVHRLGVPLIMLTGVPESPLAKHADIHIRVAINKEACPLNLAPTASTTATLAMGDALAMAVAEAKGFSPADFARLHPGGQLGRQLGSVSDFMHSGDGLARVLESTGMRETIYEMSRGKLGIAAVTNSEGKLRGCISDGDLRRLLEKDAGLLNRTAGDCMTTEPHTITPDKLAADALKRMEDHRITSLFVCDQEGLVQGIVHVHDLWGLELF